MGPAAALFAAGIILLAMVMVRALAAPSFASPASLAITSLRNPPGFWLGVGIPGAFGLVLCLAALARLA